jgi:hypothetical protein
MNSGSGGAARADLRSHRKWRWWKICFAYLVLTAIASAAIWFVDRYAMRVQVERAIGK